MKLVIGDIQDIGSIWTGQLVTRGPLTEMRTSNLSENILADADGLWAFEARYSEDGWSSSPEMDVGR